jgi:hypothetical protein
MWLHLRSNMIFDAMTWDGKKLPRLPPTVIPTPHILAAVLTSSCHFLLCHCHNSTPPLRWLDPRIRLLPAHHHSSSSSDVECHDSSLPLLAAFVTVVASFIPGGRGQGDIERIVQFSAHFFHPFCSTPLRRQMPRFTDEQAKFETRRTHNIDIGDGF